MSNNEKKKPQLNESTYLNALVGQRVKLTFLDGTALEAVFVSLDRYQLFVKDGSQVLMIFKHSIKHIAPAGNDDD